MANFKEMLNNVNWTKVIGIAAAVGTGVLAAVNAIGDQRKAEEFEQMKKTVADLQNKE